MKAVRIHHQGDSSVLVYEDAPVPSILPDEVLIKVHSAGVNPLDWKIRMGYGNFHNAYNFPLTLGWDVSGTIEQAGPLIKNFKPGDTVFARPDLTRNGAYAEYVAVRGLQLAHPPSHISLQEASGIPTASQTAWMAIFDKGNLQKDQKILIHGGSGSVGSFAVQFARLANAHVIATTSTENIDLVKSLGADEVIDYKTEDFTKKVSGADLVLDLVGGQTQSKSWQTIRKGGILVSTVGADEKAGAQFNILAVSLGLAPNGARLQHIAALVDAGLIRLMKEIEFPLSEAKAAHDLGESGHAPGKIILRVQ
jgi:NADPH:quinone reductase-like Zn-dependent oxidoreductase